MQPVLNLWREGIVRPTGWPGDVLALDPWQPPSQLLARITAWVEQHPQGWLVACGPAVALLVQLATERLDLRIAGAALVAPQDWRSLHGHLPLTDPPLPFPAVMFPQDASGQAISLREIRLAKAWNARIGGALSTKGPLASPLMQDMMAERLWHLQPGLQAAASAGSAPKVARDLAPSTAATAPRTPGIVRRTRYLAASRQSAQAT